MKEYISDEQVVKRANAAVKIELGKMRAMDVPIAVYDRKTQTIYEEDSNGSRKEVGKSTFTELLKPPIEYINADEIQKNFKEGNAMENKKLSKEQIKKAREAKTPEELQKLAAENDIQLTTEEAEQVYAQLHHGSSQLTDEELDNVSGGGCSSSGCPHCGSNNLDFRGMFMQYDVLYCNDCHYTFYS